MSLQRWAWLLVFCLLILACDIFSKAYSFCCIPALGFAAIEYPYGGIPVFHDFGGVDFSITYVANKGAAWGFFASYQTLLLYTRMAIVLCLVLYLITAHIPFKKRLSLAFITTGALGNIIDYFVYGHVVDMFYFRFWGFSYPVFNVADAAICLGAVFFIFLSYFEQHSWSKK